MKTLLIPFFDDDAARSALAHAILIARRFNSHIEGIFIAPSPQIVHGGVGMEMIGSYTTETEKDIQQQAAQAKSCFEEVLAQHDITPGPMRRHAGSVSAGWRDQVNKNSHAIGNDGRVFDLIVVGRGYGHQWTDWNIICESALFETGRPLLITGHRVDNIGDHIAIAWNRSTETARTVALSMPILLDAAKVSVLTLDGWSVPGPDGEQLVSNLLHSGINASLVEIDPDDRSPGQAIVEEATAIGADMLVKGAYTQSRLRQFVFGGATRHILQSADLPVIMAH